MKCYFLHLGTSFWARSIIIVYYYHAGINIAPVTQHANLDYTTFFCRATGLNSCWFIQSSAYSSRNHTEDGYRFGEVIQFENWYVVHDMYLDVPTTIENNGTTVQCAVFVDTATVSEEVKLIIYGE